MAARSSADPGARRVRGAGREARGAARSGASRSAKVRGLMSADQITITLPDGATKSVPSGTTVAEFVRTQIGPGLAKAALYATYDGQAIDLSRALDH